MLAFAHANEVGGGDEIAERSMQEAAGQEGLQITEKLSVDSDFDLHGLVDDSTIYRLNAQAAAPPTNPPGPSTRWRVSGRMVSVTTSKACR